jgi:hypothetical protein
MGNCCETIFPSASATNKKSNTVEPQVKSKTPPTGLDSKYHGKQIRLNKSCTVATGAGLVLGKESLNTDKIYFEVTFQLKDKDSASKDSMKKQKLSELNCSTPNPHKDNEETSSTPTPSTPDSTSTLPPPPGATPATPTTPATADLPYFQLGVAIKSNIKNRALLNKTGQPSTLDEDDKKRWMWTWGPNRNDVQSKKDEKHVLGIAYDQSVGTGTIVVYYNGAFACGPLPGGIRGIKGTCNPLVVLTPDTFTKVIATCNFSVNECDFTYPPPDGFTGIIPAMNAL